MKGERMKGNIFKILFILIFSISYSSAKEYSVGLLIEIASEKAQKYQNIDEKTDRLYNRYNKGCNYDQGCMQRSYSRARSELNTDRYQREAHKYLKKLIQAYEKNPIELTEKQRYMIESNLDSIIGIPRNTKLYKLIHGR
jgi:hypothetical protein